MYIKLIKFNNFSKAPTRAHLMDVGADVYSTEEKLLTPHETFAFSLGFGLEVPNGYAAFVYPRSSTSKKGLISHLTPVDPGYTGEIHCVLENNSNHCQVIKVGDKIGQLIILPIIIADFVDDLNNNRGTGAFGSTDKK